MLLSIVLSTEPARAETLKARFIGNEAFEITDGKVTLLTDFPYHSGAFGYMKYRFEDVKPTGKVLCLITHRHEAHFNAAPLKKTDWFLMGPTGRVRGMEPSRIVPLEGLVRFEGIEIRPVKTPHGDLEHYSYWVRWHGQRLYFSGDTEILDALLGVGKLDVAFVSPWLLESWQATGGPQGVGKVIVYHHRPDEKIQPCDVCVVPEQGDTIEIPYASAAQTNPH